MNNTSLEATPQRYTTDPETGFIVVVDNKLQGHGIITKDGLRQERSVTPAIKLEVLKYLSECWPNITKACEKAGISRLTWRNHVAADPKLAELVDQIAESKTDEIEAFQSELASKNKLAFMDRAMSLRANRASKFDPARRLVLESQTRIDEPTARLRMASLKNVIDAEIVSDGLRDWQDGAGKKQAP